MRKNEIKEIVMDGATGEYSHVLICCDTFDYEDYPVYVKYGEDIRKVIESHNNSQNMSRVMEVYNYNLDLERQLNESMAYHIEPLGRIKKDTKRKEESTINHNDDISENLKKAIEYATKMHKGQTRLTGEPYINHPLHVLQNVLKYKESKNIETLLISACLHDTIEDTSATYYDIVERFGPQVASLVLEVTTDEDMKNALGKCQYLSIKMKNMSSWALVIKLCDRLDNVNDLLRCKDDKFKNKYINETIEILNYLIENAKLSKTHVTIIEQIINLLIQLCKDDIEKIIRLVELIEKYTKLKTQILYNKEAFEETEGIIFYEHDGTYYYDSENVIANMVNVFEYDSNRQQEVLAKYEKLKERNFIRKKLT